MSPPSLVFVFGLILSLAFAQGEKLDGYMLSEDSDSFWQRGTEAGERTKSLKCPSNNVIKTRYRCKVDRHWEDCSRQSCCPGYTLLLGQCVSADADPCSLGLCPQQCAVFLGRVVCTCFNGYQFNAERYRAGAREAEEVCQDLDECAEEDVRSSCDHLCTNTPGSYQCSCHDGFTLSAMDNTTCLPEALGARRPFVTTVGGQGTCVANCHTIKRLKATVATMEERIRGLATALKLYTVTAGAPGPQGPPGPKGTKGPRGFPGPTGRGVREAEALTSVQADEDDFEDDGNGIDQEDFDSYKMVKNGGKKSFCKCKRGRVGPPGAPGGDGQRGLPGSQGLTGKNGEPGSFDFLMLMLTDIRHDLEALKSKVYSPEDRPSAYNVKQHMIWEKRMRGAWESAAWAAKEEEEQLPRVQGQLMG